MSNARCARLAGTALCYVLCELSTAVRDISAATKRWWLARSLKAVKHACAVVPQHRRPPYSLV